MTVKITAIQIDAAAVAKAFYLQCTSLPVDAVEILAEFSPGAFWIATIVDEEVNGFLEVELVNQKIRWLHDEQLDHYQFNKVEQGFVFTEVKKEGR